MSLFAKLKFVSSENFRQYSFQIVNLKNIIILHFRFLKNIWTFFFSIFTCLATELQLVHFVSLLEPILLASKLRKKSTNVELKIYKQISPLKFVSCVKLWLLMPDMNSVNCH